jgi:hypothetical protein
MGCLLFFPQSTDISSRPKNKQYLLYADFFLADFSNVKIEATISSETLVGFQQNIRRYIPKDITLRSHCCEKK